MHRAVERKWAWSAEDECGEARDIEQIALVSGWPELRTAGSDGDQLDGAESELKVNPEHCDEQDCCHGQCKQGYEAAGEYGEAADYFDQDGKPGHQVRGWYGEAVQRGGEDFRATNELGVAVLDEAKANHEAERKRREVRERVSGS